MLFVSLIFRRGEQRCVKCGLAEGEMHTTTCSGCKPIVKWVQTNSGTGAYHYSFAVQTNSGSRVDLYWSRPLNQIEAQLYATLWTFFPLFIAEVHYLILRLSSISLSFDGNFSTLRTKAVVSSYTIVKYPLCSHAFKTGSILSLSLYIIGGKASHV